MDWEGVVILACVTSVFIGFSAFFALRTCGNWDESEEWKTSKTPTETFATQATVTLA